MRGISKVKACEAGCGSPGIPCVGYQCLSAGQRHGHPPAQASVVVIAGVVDVLGGYSPAKIQGGVGCVLAGGSDEHFIG